MYPNQIVYCHLYAHIIFVLAFELILVYFQHTFYFHLMKLLITPNVYF